MILRNALTKYNLLLSFLFFISIDNCRGQSFTTHLYTTADGLTDNYILCVFQDSYGYLWIGTANGLNRFDGVNFINFRLQQGLPSLYVDQVYEDHLHRLWVGTRGGIAELRGDSCYPVPLSDGLSQLYVSSFFEPDADHLWATTNAGVYELRKNLWVKINLAPGYNKVGVGKIVQTSQGLFIDYDNKTVVWKQQDGKCSAIFSVEANHPYFNSLFARHDTVYMGAYSSLTYWINGKWTSLYADTLSKKHVYHSYCDGSGRFWMGTESDGILIISSLGGHVKYDRIPLAVNLVSRFWEDHENNVWVAGFEGLMKVSTAKYQTISLPELKTLGSIRNFIIMRSGSILVAGEGGKLLLLQPSPSFVNSYRVAGSFKMKNRDDEIVDYTRGDKADVWCVSLYGQLYKFDGNSLLNLTPPARPVNSYSRSIIFSQKTKKLFVCGDSVLFFGDQNRLDTFFGKDGKRFVPIPHRAFIDQGDESILVQTVEDGLYRIDSDKNISSLGTKIDLSVSTPYDVASGNDKMRFWVADERGNIRNYTWQKSGELHLGENISEKDGVPNTRILDLITDPHGKLWFATSKGVLVLQKNAQHGWIHQDIDITETGASVPLSYSKLGSDSMGNIWMSVHDQFLKFNTKEDINTSFTKTIIEKILINEKYTDWSKIADSVTGYNKLPVNPHLKHSQNTFSISFKGLQYKLNPQLEYSYRLEPLDSNWSNPITGNLVSFYQLAPGHYKFEVRSHIKGFDWSEPADFSFTIERALWETWWFRLSAALLGAALIVFIFRYRLRQLKEKTEIAAELRALETKAFKLQMNPHFIHNALNSIQSLVINNKNSEASHYINKFAKLLRQVLENSDMNLVPLEKELLSLQLYVDLEKLRMDMDISYLVSFSDDILNSGVQIPPLILQPFVENALWHGLSRKEGEKKIMLTIKNTRDWLICEVTDNGVGRKKAASAYESFPEGHLSKAVNIIRHRLIDFNQAADVDPVRFVDLEENGIATGTSVIISVKAPFG